MASKRTFQEEGQGNDDRDLRVPSKRRHGNPEEAKTRAAAGNHAANEIALCLKPVIRELMQEMMQEVMEKVIPTMLQRNLSPCSGLLTLNQQTGTSGGRALQLCFMNKLPQVIFTQLKITAEGGAALQVELRDASRQQRIVRDEKIRICVLDGDFGSEGNEDWTAEDFNAQTLSPREGKGPLLNGVTVITLKNGVRYIPNNIVFTDNSSWTKSKTFRLGVKLVQSNSIREGRSEPFKVLDYRGQVYMKHERPSLNDEVWRLKNIRKGGELHKQLISHGIKTVKDLLQLYTTNQASLRERMRNISRRSWDVIIAHAKGCVVDDDQRYIYQAAAEQDISLVFNCIYEVVEVIFNGRNSRSIQSLNLEEERFVERVKQQAYNNLKDLKPLDIGMVKTRTGGQTALYGGPDQGMQRFDLPFGQPVTWASSSTSGINEASGSEFEDAASAPIDSWDALFASFLDDSPNWNPSNPNWNPLNPFDAGDGSEASNHSTFP